MLNWHSKKFTLQIAGVFAVVLILFGVSFFQSLQDNKLEVNFFDVGQGDAILIKTPDHQKILIDGGPDNTIINKLGENLPFYDKEIDLMILTHPHADHVTGLVEVLKRYKVKKILATGVLCTTSEYIAWLEEIKKQKIPMEIAQAGQIISFGENLKLEILYPLEDLSGKQFENLNNSSVVGKLTFGETSFLFTGDAETEVEKKLISSNFDFKVDVLKVAHHGSKNATSQEFLDKVQPKFAVISVGAKNKFGHPSQGTINRLKKMNAQVFRTDKDGDVRISSNGEKIEVNVQ
jgi:competence protein ComEC